MLDSGVGGLSVLRELQALAPSQPVIYFADQGHLPYGPRPRHEIQGFVTGIARFLLAQGCTLLVLACNAANAAALGHVRSTFPNLPIVGMEPAIKPAAAATKSGLIGVITTQATYQGDLFASVIDRFASGLRVITQVCPDFVALAEQGAPDTPETRALIARDLAPLRAAGIDQLVLGCTHFPFLTHLISAYLGPGVAIIDPAPAVARQTLRLLGNLDLPRIQPPGTPTRYLTTGDPARFQAVLHALTGIRAEAQPVRWQDMDVLSL
jgi:glutamate racemase